MLDKTHGWALTPNFVLKTADGGLHWQNVMPANAFGKNAMLGGIRGAFLNDQDAWIVAAVGSSPNGKSSPLDTIMVLRTTDGGKSWQNSTIHNPAGGSPNVKFLNASEGWILLTSMTSIGNLPALFHTTDGGQHWNQLGKPDPNVIHIQTGISFKDGQNGWVAGSSKGPPTLEVTHDGGKTWQNQSLLMPPGVDKSVAVNTLPPILFGSNGLLPVADYVGPQPGGTSSIIGLNLYVTHNGGQTWTPTKHITLGNLASNGPAGFTVDATDSQHAWAALSTSLSVTSDGGQSWTKLPPIPQPIKAEPIDGTLSFTDTNNGWGITSTNLLHTADGGRTWQQVNYFVDGKPITTSRTV